MQTYADVLDPFRNHPESKSADPDGNPSDSWTSGVLGRLNVHVWTVSYIGKETNLLEQQEEGVLTTDPQAVYWGGGEWEAIRSYLYRVSIPELSDRSGVSPRTLQYLRRGDHQPSAKTLQDITEALVLMLEEAEG